MLFRKRNRNYTIIFVGAVNNTGCTRITFVYNVKINRDLIIRHKNTFYGLLYFWKSLRESYPNRNSNKYYNVVNFVLCLKNDCFSKERSTVRSLYGGMH